MGGLFAKPPPVQKPVLPQAPTIDYSAAKFDASYVQQLQQQSAAAVEAARRAAEEQAKKLATTTGMLSAQKWKYIFMFIALILLVVGVILLYDLAAQKFGWPTVILTAQSSSSPPPVTTPILYLNSAKYGAGTTTVDVSSYLNTKIVNGTYLPSFIVSAPNVGLGENPVPNTPNTLYVTWYVGNGDYVQTTVNEGQTFPSLPTSGYQTPSPVTKSPPPPLSKSFFSFLTGSDSSGDLLGTSHDASSSTTIDASHAPLSDQGDGAYGVQWWMFVKDWNYGFGKKKSIVKRPDVTNKAVTNPHISLHPTDNTLQVSVSIFPSGEQAGKTTPAPAGHSGATDDVFTCDVPNIPLQTWFSVGVTVFGRNLDIYIDGKLVKSCLMPGVPKPAVGDIQVTPDGGFSGQICNFNHYSRMLTPGDAMNFWSAGTSCQSASQKPVTKATGYAVKFGVYDSTGKQVQEYSF